MVLTKRAHHCTIFQTSSALMTAHPINYTILHNFSVIKDNSSIFFWLKPHIVWTKVAHRSEFFGLLKGWVLLDKLQKRICRTVGPSLAASLEPLPYHRNVANLSLFYRYYFIRCSSELAQLVPLSFSQGRSTLTDCMIFLSPFLDVTRMSIATVSFLAQLDSGILCLRNTFFLPLI